MKLWETIITAVDPITGCLTRYQGPHIEAFTPSLAHQYCQTNGLGYCKITGERIVSEVTTHTKTGKITRIIDFDDHQNN
jgi:hypothetical protein